MLYHASFYLKNYISAFNVFHYVSFRCMGSLLTALLLSFLFGDWFINKSRLFFRSKSREYTPENHRAKDDMPTMGGAFMLAITFISALLWCNLSRPEVWIFLLCLLLFGAIGFWDDINKIWYKKGISEKHKFRAQILSALIVVLLWIYTVNPSTSLILPLFKNFRPDLGIFFIFWAIFIIVGTSNAVNLTDGLDGLAIGSLISNFATFSLICYLAGHASFAQYLNIPFADTSEIAIIGTILLGVSLGFLWYNAYPAQIFMGDVGSLALGSGLALMALMCKQEILLSISGALFVVEALSVIVQVFSFKFFGKRIFRMAPIHHHFELLGWQESKITTRFGIISLVLCLVSLMLLKMG